MVQFFPRIVLTTLTCESFMLALQDLGDNGVKAEGSLQPNVTVTFTLTVKAKMLLCSMVFFYQYAGNHFRNIHIKDCASQALFGLHSGANIVEQTRKHNCENLKLLSLFSILFYSNTNTLSTSVYILIH